MTSKSADGWRIEGKHVLMALVVFFGIMFLANGVFVYFAVSTFNGEETTDAYRRGLAYNSRLTEAAEQKAHGWAGKIDIREDPTALVLDLRDGSNVPVSGLEVRAKIGRPATDKFDHGLIFSEEAPGIYAVHFPRWAPGAWIVAIEATKLVSKGERVAYRHKERLWLKPPK